MGQQGIYAAPNLDVVNRDRVYPATMNELLEAARPLMKLIAERYGPYTKAIVTNSEVELMDGTCRTCTEDYIQD